MKKSYLIIVMLIALSIPVYAASGLSNVVEIKIGGKVWYCWWRPPWGDGVTYAAPGDILPVSTPFKIHQYRTSPAFMYGFTASAQFLDSWIFSSSLMYGNYFSKSSTPDPLMLLAYQKFSHSKDIKKYDFDSRIGYQVNNYFGVYLCVRTISYNYIEHVNNAQASVSSSIEYASANSEFIDAGPGLGIGIRIPLYKDLSFVLNLSGLLLAGSGNYAYRYHYVIGTDITQLFDQFQKESYYSYSGNGYGALEYYIRPAGIVLQLGGKYDIMYYRHHRVWRGFLNYADKYDHFYGISFATIYSFTLADSTAMR